VNSRGSEAVESRRAGRGAPAVRIKATGHGKAQRFSNGPGEQFPDIAISARRDLARRKLSKRDRGDGSGSIPR